MILYSPKYLKFIIVRRLNLSVRNYLHQQIEFSNISFINKIWFVGKLSLYNFYHFNKIERIT